MLDVDESTLDDWNFQGSLENITLRFMKTVAPDILLRLPGSLVKDLCLERKNDNNESEIEDYHQLCIILRDHYPRLISLTFKELTIGNDEVMSILQFYKEDIHLQVLRYVSSGMCISLHFSCNSNIKKKWNSYINNCLVKLTWLLNLTNRTNDGLLLQCI